MEIDNYEPAVVTDERLFSVRDEIGEASLFVRGWGISCAACIRPRRWRCRTNPFIAWRIALTARLDIWIALSSALNQKIDSCVWANMLFDCLIRMGLARIRIMKPLWASPRRHCGMH